MEILKGTYTMDNDEVKLSVLEFFSHNGSDWTTFDEIDDYVTYWFDDDVRLTPKIESALDELVENGTIEEIDGIYRKLE